MGSSVIFLSIWEHGFLFNFDNTWTQKIFYQEEKKLKADFRKPSGGSCGAQNIYM
jgi:hypothetical protein